MRYVDHKNQAELQTRSSLHLSRLHDLSSFLEISPIFSVAVAGLLTFSSVFKRCSFMYALKKKKKDVAYRVVILTAIGRWQVQLFRDWEAEQEPPRKRMTIFALTANVSGKICWPFISLVELKSLLVVMILLCDSSVEKFGLLFFSWQVPSQDRKLLACSLFRNFKM